MSAKPFASHNGSKRRGQRFSLVFCTVVPTLIVLVTAAVQLPSAKDGKQPVPGEGAIDAGELRVVDCLLPGQVRKMGRNMTYLTQRRPVRTTALDCQIRGGEYVEYDRANYATALKVWLETAEAGDPQAQYYVGEIYEKGLGIAPGYKEAAEWYSKSAEQGYAPAQINLAFLYEKGLGVAPDPKLAIEWYRRASGLPGVVVLNSEFEEIQQQLAESNARLETAEATAQELEQDLSEARRELSEEKNSSQRSSARVKELKGRVDSLAGELNTREEELTELRSDQMQFRLPGPTIEVFDPSVSRDGSGPSSSAPVELVGIVEAPAGFAQLTVNQVRTQVDPSGFFRFPVGSEKEFKLVAVDLQGKTSEESYELRGTTIGPADEDTRKVRQPKFGPFHALIIGNDEYENMPDLETAVADAKAVAELLEKQYGFEVKLLLNADSSSIFLALSSMQKKLGDKDNLLIYYAGHGEIDASTGMGFWLPVDADRDNKRLWVSSTDIGSQLEQMQAAHVLVVADSCYSGWLTRSSIPQFESESQRSEWIAKNPKKRSRTALSSGGLKPVLDAGGSGHSIFAQAFLDRLESNDATLETQKLWTAVRARVEFTTRKLDRPQIPEYGPIQYSGHELGDFFFVRVAG